MPVAEIIPRQKIYVKEKIRNPVIMMEIEAL
jgi:hypothetical protein